MAEAPTRLNQERKCESVKEATCIKVITQNLKDIDKLAKILEDYYNVVASSQPIYDEVTKKYHIFLNLFEKVEA
jgi:hypothetical protein